MRDPKRTRAGNLFGGTVMIVLGVGFLLAQMDILSDDFIHTWWTYWPAVLIVIGLFRLVRPRHARDIGSGVTSILFGLWFFANKFEWWGLTWRTSWPIALMAVGAGMVVRSVAATFMTDDSEKKKEEEAMSHE